MRIFGKRKGTVALSDLERRAPQIFRFGPMATDPTAPIRPISVGQGGRLTAWCGSQPEYLLQRDEVDPLMQQCRQYTSVAFTQRLLDEGVDPSVGSVGDAFDNAMAETTVGSFTNELIRRQGPWRDVDHVELGTAEWVVWFNTERPHEHLDDFTPEAVEKPHCDHRRALPEAG